MFLAFTFSWLIIRLAVICLAISIIIEAIRKISNWLTKK